MSFSALDLITRAMRLLEVIDAIEEPEAEESAEGFAVLNEIVEDLGLQRQALAAVARTVHPLTALVPSYTIGTGGALNIDRPASIEFYSVIPDRNSGPPAFELPRGVPLTDQEWENLPVKSLQGTFPTKIYYDFSWTAGLARIYVWPVPTQSSSDLVLYVPTAVQPFANLSTLYTFPPGYGRMLRYNLAIELAPWFKVQPSPIVIQKATDSLANIKTSNDRPRVLTLDSALLSTVARRGNIYTGET